MNQKHLAIVGCGDIGQRVGRLLLPAGWRVTGFRRRPEALPVGFDRVLGDYTRAGDLVGLAALKPTHVLFTPLPTSRSVDGYQQGFVEAVRGIEASGLLAAAHYALMVSSTRVYAESDGGWVEEHSPLTKTDPAAQAMMAAEQAWLAGARHATVARATGIYGSLPGMLLSRVREGRASADPARYSNRIHRDDLAAALAFLLDASASHGALPDTLIVTDDRPAPIGEVERWLAERLGVELAPEAAAPGGSRGNRRCSNRLLRDLGVTLAFPDYQSGYRALLGQ